MEELAHAAQLEPMAISGYLGCLIILLIAYPFCIVALAIIADGERQRMRWQKYFNWIYLVTTLTLLVLHLNIYVEYGGALRQWLEQQETIRTSSQK